MSDQDRELTIGEALRAIAERTPFRTEEERRDVLAAIDRESESDARYAEPLDGDDQDVTDDGKSDPDAPAAPDGGTPDDGTRTAKQGDAKQPAKRPARR